MIARFRPISKIERAITARSVKSPDLDVWPSAHHPGSCTGPSPYVRRPFIPGASFAAVCPPDFTVPTSVNVSSLRLSQWKTTFVICRVSALDRELHLLDVLVQSTAFALDRCARIGGLDSSSWPSTNHLSSAALALPSGTHEGDGRDNKRGDQGADLRLHRGSFQDRCPPTAGSHSKASAVAEGVWAIQYVPTSAKIKVNWEEFPFRPGIARCRRQGPAQRALGLEHEPSGDPASGGPG